MTIPAPLKDWADIMGRTVNRVPGIFANDELSNVKNGLENIAGMIVMSDAIRTAMQQMLEELRPLRRLLNNPGILVGGSALEEAKAKAWYRLARDSTRSCTTQRDYQGDRAGLVEATESSEA